MVVATATGHRILLCQTQPGQGLAGIQQAHAGAFNQIGIVAAARGDTGQGLQEVQRRALPTEQRTRRPFELEQYPTRLDLLAIDHLPVHRNTRIELPKHAVHPGRTTDDGSLASDDRGMRQALRGDQLRGNVTRADILGQRTTNIAFDFSAKIGDNEIGHRQAPVEFDAIIEARLGKGAGAGAARCTLFTTVRRKSRGYV